MRKFSSMLMAALICVLIFCGCEALSIGGAQSGAQASTAESSSTESSAQSEQSESLQEESSAEESQQIDNPPDDSEIGSILETNILEYLNEKYGITDWELLFEYGYYNKTDGNDRYKANYVAVFGTEAGSGFDRVVVKGYKNGYGLNRYIFFSGKSSERLLNCGDFEGAQVLFLREFGRNSYPIIWVPKTSTTIFIDHDKPQAVTIKGAEEPVVIGNAMPVNIWYRSDGQTKVKVPESRNDDALIFVEQPDGSKLLSYYDFSEQSLKPFEGVVSNTGFNYAFITDTCMEYIEESDDTYYFYDFSDGADPTVAFFKFSSDDLPGGEFDKDRLYEAVADRNDSDRYLLAYADTNGKRFYLVYFSFEEGILTELPFEKEPLGYLGKYSLRGGIAYISYKKTSEDSYEHYAVDLRPDKDHTLQANAW